jgi:hypothetical protein
VRADAPARVSSIRTRTLRVGPSTRNAKPAGAPAPSAVGLTENSRATGRAEARAWPTGCAYVRPPADDGAAVPPVP